MAGRSFVAMLGAALLATAGVARADAPPAADPPPPPPSPPRASLALNPIRPPPLHVEYAQYGVAIHAIANVSSGAVCGSGVVSPTKSTVPPCILGGGGGLVIRGGYRSPGPWYFGGSYSFAKMDSSNLYRLGIYQQLAAEVRYLPDTGYRATPYATWGLGGVWYGNEWGVETGGAMLIAGGGLEFQVTRFAVVGLGLVYKPTLFVGWTDTAGIVRPTGLAHFLGFEIQLEVRSELGRR